MLILISYENGNNKCDLIANSKKWIKKKCYPVKLITILVPYIIDKELELSLNIVKAASDIFIHVNKAICLLSFTIGFTNSILSPVFANVISNSEM